MTEGLPKRISTDRLIAYLEEHAQLAADFAKRLPKPSQAERIFWLTQASVYYRTLWDITRNGKYWDLENQINSKLSRLLKSLS